jgi:dynein heavy chain, axonemal
VEIEHAVEDLVKIISAYQLDSHVESVSEEEIMKLKRHYNHFMYQALLHCAKNSMNTLKKRIASRSGSITNLLIKPFFEVNVHLTPPSVILQVCLACLPVCPCASDVGDVEGGFIKQLR